MLGVDRWNIQKAMDRWIQLDATKDAFWITFRQEKHPNSLPQFVKDLVAHWWTVETNVFPIAKDVIRRHIGVKLDETHLAHFFQVSQVQMFTCLRT